MGGVKVLPYTPQSGCEEVFAEPHSLDQRLDDAIEAIIVGMLAFAPWPFGSVTRWSEEIVIAGAACLAFCFFLRLLVNPLGKVVRSWAYLPIGVFLAISLFQLLPFPPAALRYISPHTVAVKSRLLADISGAASAPMTVTFYPWSTLHDLRLVFALGVVFFVVLNTCRTPRRLKRLLVSICIVGGAVISLALAQDLSGADKIYWTYKEFELRANAGPFLNHSHFCQYISLTTGAALALLLMMRARSDSARQQPAQNIGEWALTRWAYVLLLGVLLAAAAMALCLALSRGGFVAALLAGAIIIVMNAARRSRADGWIFTTCLAIIAIGVFIYAQGAVSRRLATLEHPLTEYNARWQIIKDICAAWPHFPILGVGLGTHEVAYPMFEHLHYTPVFDHAENEFAQMLEETGALGLAAVVGFLVIVGIAFFKAAGASGSIRAAALGLGFGFIAIVVQSCSDFGQHIPAIALVTAVECALLINLADLRAARVRRPDPPTSRGRLHLAVAVVAAFGIGVAFVVALYQADRARIAETIWQPSHKVADAIGLSFAQLNSDQFLDIINNASAAHKADPDNIRYLYQLGNFEWMSIQMKHDPALPQNVRSAGEQAEAGKIIEIFNRVRRICPCYGNAMYMTGQLEYYVFGQAAGADLIRLSAEIAPTNPYIALQVASIDCDQRRFGDAVNDCRRFLSLHGVIEGDFSDVTYVLVHLAQRPDLALVLAGDDPERLLDIVSDLRNLQNRADFQALAKTLQEKASGIRRAQLVEACRQPDASAADLAELAEIYRSENRWSESIEYYQRALVLDYGQVEWRLHLAQAMLAAGRPNDAVNEAEICLRLQPQTDAAEQVIATATTQPSYSAQP